jgi:hypothetical protein
MKKICPKCQLEKDITEFRRDPTRAKGVYPYCIPCEKNYRNEYMSAYRKQEDTLEYLREYSARPLTRALKLYNSARQRAERKGEMFSLSLERIKLLLDNGVCQRTGLPFDLASPTETRFNPFAPSIDKIDHQKPYTDDNTQLVIDWYNRAKGQHSDADLLAFCKQVIAFAEEGRFNDE